MGYFNISFNIKAWTDQNFEMAIRGFSQEEGIILHKFFEFNFGQLVTHEFVLLTNKKLS